MALRNLARHRVFAILNISGLAIGIASCILLFMVISYELSYDQFLPGHQQVVHVMLQNKDEEGVRYQPGVPFPALEALRSDVPAVTAGALYASDGSQVTVVGKDPNASSEKKYIEDEGMRYADPEFFAVFPYTWLSGTPKVLSQPNNTVLTKSTAEKYFGDWKQAMGQYIRLDNSITLRVAGIIQDPPKNSDFPMKVVSSFITFRNAKTNFGYNSDWGSVTSNFQIYMKLPPQFSETQLDAQLASLSPKYIKTSGVEKKTLMSRPLSEIHFDPRMDNLGDHVISRSTIWTLSLVGLFILIMACINFINLSTAQAVNRSKEIGIRKVLGGRRGELFAQMMGETALIVLAALVLGLALSALCLPLISHVTSINESLSIFTVPVIGFALLLAVVVTFLAGSYPSLVISGFRPLLALKNKFTSASVAGVSLRRGLVVAQFAISQVLIIGTIVAVTQMSYIRQADIGFKKEAVFVLRHASDSTIHSRQERFRQQLQNTSGVQGITFASDVPTSDNNWSSNFAYNHQSDASYNVFMKFADEEYFRTYGLRFAAGTGYGKSDTTVDVVINETLAKRLESKDESLVVGKDFRLGGGRWFRIAGVVKDFKTNSLRDELKPLIILPVKSYYGTTSVKIASANLAITRDAVQKVWNGVYPEYANTSSFLEDDINDFYSQENQLALLYKIFAGIAIFISCLGLYGLVSFMAVQRTREVGIRKTLGASAANIVYLFSKEFTLLVGIAFVVAAPIAWFLMKSWLGNFAYRISLGAGVFLAAIGVSLGIAWITVGYKSVKAALANPVRSLRNE